MLLTKEVEIIPTGKMIQYYRNLGYDAKHRKPLVVKVEDLQNGSNIKLEVLCDLCQTNIMSVQYFDYNKIIEKTGSYVCKDCVYKKRMNTMYDKYGVYYASQVTEFKEKAKNTSLARFGVDCPSKSDEIKERTRLTNIQKYGVPYTMQSPEVRTKANETLYKNGKQKTSRQQLYLHSLYGGELNYPIYYYAVDICFPEEKLIIEYDGGFHDGRVKLGNLTQEEFNQKEIIRNNIIKREGYKQMRITSKNDYLPSDTILLQMLEQAKQYFTSTNHSWCTYDIDQSLLFNAENKDGVPYHYGELRKIKKTDIIEENSVESNQFVSLETA